MNELFDAASIGRVAEAVGKVIPVLAVAGQYVRGRQRKRRADRAKADTENAATEALTQKLKEDEETGRWMRSAVFNSMDLSEQLAAQVGKTGLALEERDLWRRLAAQHESDLDRWQARYRAAQADLDARDTFWARWGTNYAQASAVVEYLYRTGRIEGIQRDMAGGGGERGNT